MRRGKTDFTTMFVWLIILAVPVVIGTWCYTNLKAVGDPANLENYWQENMYTYRAALEDADVVLDRGDYEEAREAYQDAIEANAKNEYSIVLRDRIARAWYLEGLAHHANDDWTQAIRCFRSGLDAVGQTNQYAAREQRPTNHRYADEITTEAKIIDAMVESLVSEGVNLRDNLGQLDSSRDLLLDARRRRPRNYRACKEVVTLFRLLQVHSPYLEALRHVLDNLPAPDNDSYSQFVSDNPEYGQLNYYQNTVQAHTQFQDYILSNYPVEEWYPIVNGMTLQYHEVYSQIGGGTYRGRDFTRTMTVNPSNPNIGFIAEPGSQPDFIIRWENTPMGRMLVEEWTSNLSGGDTHVYWDLPEHPRMGMSWRNPNGTTFRITDLIADPDHEFKLIMSGYQLGNWELTYGVGRTSITPLSSDHGEYLDNAIYPGG